MSILCVGCGYVLHDSCYVWINYLCEACVYIRVYEKEPKLVPITPEPTPPDASKLTEQQANQALRVYTATIYILKEYDLEYTRRARAATSQKPGTDKKPGKFPKN